MACAGGSTSGQQTGVGLSAGGRLDGTYQAIRIVNGATAYAGWSWKILVQGVDAQKQLPLQRVGKVVRRTSSWRGACRRVGFLGYRGQGGLAGGGGGLTQPQC